MGMNRSDDPNSVLKKAFPRCMKSLLHTYQWEAAKNALDKNNADEPELAIYKQVIAQAETIGSEWSRLDNSQLPPQVSMQSSHQVKLRLFFSLPRYKVAM